MILSLQSSNINDVFKIQSKLSESEKNLEKSIFSKGLLMHKINVN